MKKQKYNKTKELTEEELEKLQAKFEELKNVTAAQKQEQVNFTKELISRAQSGQHSEFQFLHNLMEAAAARKFLVANKHLVRGFKMSMSKCMEQYVESVKTGMSRLDLLISYKELMPIVEFYEEEQKLVKDMLAEYRCYVWSNHILNTLLGVNRPLEDETDWRKLKISWNPFKR